MGGDLDQRSPIKYGINNIKKGKERMLNFKIPKRILDCSDLNTSIFDLSKNYNFEIHKTIWFLELNEIKVVALQFPEGLAFFACQIADIIEQYAKCEVILMGDIVYGACCVDDFTARQLGAEAIIHYGHSCLVPISETNLTKVLYVFVDMNIDESHLLETIRTSFMKNQSIYVISTVQFVRALQSIQTVLKSEGFNINSKQSYPLSKGEVLGCTSPDFQGIADIILYVGDGRFHIEAAMIQNPTIPAYRSFKVLIFFNRYDPYSKILSQEFLDFKQVIQDRSNAIDTAIKSRGTFGVLLSTLGRQGSPKVFECINNQLTKRKLDFVNVLISEITPEILLLFKDTIDIFVQIACPRLSIDWGTYFHKPILTPYEASVVCGSVSWSSTNYPMDYYTKESLGPWTPNHVANKSKI